MLANSWCWRIGVLSIHSTHVRNKTPVCPMHIYVLKTSTNKWFSACFLSLLLLLLLLFLLSLLFGHLRQHKHEYKWLSSQRQEKRVKMKKIRTTKLTPTFMSTSDVHFDRTVSFWPRQTIFNCDKLQLVQHLPDVCMQCVYSGTWSHKPNINTSHFDLLLRCLFKMKFTRIYFIRLPICCPFAPHRKVCVCVCVLASQTNTP